MTVPQITHFDHTPHLLRAAADAVKRDKVSTPETKMEIVRTLWALAADIEAGRVKLQVEKPKQAEPPEFGEV